MRKAENRQHIIKNESSAFPPITFFPEGVDVVLQGRSSDFSDSCFLPIETCGFDSGVEVLSKNTILFLKNKIGITAAGTVPVSHRSSLLIPTEIGNRVTMQM